MAMKLTQALVNRAMEDHAAGTQVYDAEVSGVRVVVGKRSAGYKLVGRINDGTDRYVSVVVGRTDEVSLRSARERAAELRLALRRGKDPRTPKATVPIPSSSHDHSEGPILRHRPALDRNSPARGDQRLHVLGIPPHVAPELGKQ